MGRSRYGDGFKLEKLAVCLVSFQHRRHILPAAHAPSGHSFVGDAMLVSERAIKPATVTHRVAVGGGTLWGSRSAESGTAR